MNNFKGTMLLTVVEGKLERNVSKFAKMDPYCKVSYRQ